MESKLAPSGLIAHAWARSNLTFAMVAVAVAVVGCGDSGDDGDEGTGGATGSNAPGESRPVDLIRGDAYPRLVIELDAVAGEALRSGVADRLTQELAALLDKPDGIEVITHGTLASPGADHAWTFSELDTLARDNFDLEVPAGTIKIHVMLVDGRSDQDDETGQVLGLAWSNTHLTIFSDTLGSACNAQSGAPIAAAIVDRLCAESERAILFHELGHVLGLVDNGLEMVHGHKDPDHGAHSDNDACLMYWAYEGPRIVDMIRTRLLAGDQTSIGFDEACLADIAAVRGNATEGESTGEQGGDSARDRSRRPGQ